MIRPIVIIGAGVLGRRIASVFLAAGHTVHIVDSSTQALHEARTFIDSNRDEFAALLHSSPQSQSQSQSQSPSQPGTLQTFTDIAPAVQNAWLAIEAVPEKLPLKTDIFAQIDHHAPADCIIGSNSSSFKSGLMVGEVQPERRKRVLNVHFTMPPGIRTVELMTCGGETREEVFGVVEGVLRACGLVVVRCKRESTGFVFNRLWAAVKREILLILSEDVSSPAEIDLLWKEMFQNPGSLPPCRLMDKIGLDTVAFIEDNYIDERGLDGSGTVDWLREKYISQGRVGLKSEKGGLYPPPHSSSSSSSASPGDGKGEASTSLYLLDVGLGQNTRNISDVPKAGRILRFQPSSGKMETLISGQSLPDGIDISRRTGRLFWTNMGAATSTNDGSVHSAKLDGSDIRTLLPAGTVHTPKQLVVDDSSGRVYFCDREGMGVHRCNFDGSGHEILVQTGKLELPEERSDMTRWCVGITLDTVRGYIYWTQKGPSKAGRGRIFRAGIEMPAGRTAENREDIELVLEGLPEPIDLEMDVEAQRLYWTDRGEHPLGCSLNCVDLPGSPDPEELSRKQRVLARHFNEPIGLKMGGDGVVYVGDLGGSVYRVKDGRKTALWRDDACYTGVSLMHG